MALKTKPNRSDPLDLIKSQHHTASDVLSWIVEARNNAREERKSLESLNSKSSEAYLTEKRAKTWDEAVDRLVDQYRTMTSG